MTNLSTHGDFPVDLIERTKAELAGELDFAEQSEPSARSGSGYPSLGNVFSHGFDFGEPPVSNFYSSDLLRLREQLKIVENNIGRGNDYGSQARAAELRREIRDHLAQHKRNLDAAQAAVGYPEPDTNTEIVETDNRGVLIPQYSEEDTEDFARCQRPDGSFYGTGGTCRKGTPAGAKTRTPEKKLKAMRKKDLERRGVSEGTRTRPKGAIESDMKKLSSSGAMQQKGAAGVKARKQFEDLKAELKKPLAGAKSKSGDGVTLDKASRAEYARQAKTEKQSIKDIKREIKSSGRTPALDKRLKQTEARAKKFETMAKTGIFQR